MRKFKHLGTTVTFKNGAYFNVSTFDKSKKLRNWLISVDYTMDDSEWLVRIFSVSYFGQFYEFRVLDNVHTERLIYERNSPSYVARLVFRHYLTTLADPGPDELPF